MAKTISISHEGRDYTLEFTRDTVSTLEKQGFRLRNIIDAPVTNIPILFAGAFQAHHQYTNRKVIDRIFTSLTNKEKLCECLIEMYSETVDSMVDEPEEGNEGNVEWGTSW